MQIQDVSDTNEQASYFSRDSDIIPIVIGGNPMKEEQPPSFSNEEEIIAATGSSSQHRRAKSKPFLLKQTSDFRKQKLIKLEKDLQKLNTRSPSFSRVTSDISTLKSHNKAKAFDQRPSKFNTNGDQSAISDIRFTSERQCDSPINAGEMFGESFEDHL